MKTKAVYLTVIITLMSFNSVFAGNPKTEEFKVSGNCSMCKTRIEKAAKSVEGVSEADWDKETKMITVTYDNSKTDVHKIHKAITLVGHDTEIYKADDKTYKALPKCCQYRGK